MNIPATTAKFLHERIRFAGACVLEAESYNPRLLIQPQAKVCTGKTCSCHVCLG